MAMVGVVKVLLWHVKCHRHPPRYGCGGRPGNDLYFFIFIWFYLLKLIPRCVFIASFYLESEEVDSTNEWLQHIEIIAIY